MARNINPPPRPDIASGAVGSTELAATTAAPTAVGPLAKEPVAIIAVLLIVAQALVLGLGLGELDDGFQAGDIGIFITTVVGAIVTRLGVFSQATVDLLANRQQQVAAAERKGGARPSGPAGTPR